MNQSLGYYCLQRRWIPSSDIKHFGAELTENNCLIRSSVQAHVATLEGLFLPFWKEPLLDSWIKLYISSLQLKKSHLSVGPVSLPWLLRTLCISSLRHEYIWLGKVNVITSVCFHVVNVLCLFLCGCCVFFFFNFKLNVRRTEQTSALSDDSFSWLFWDV